MSRPASAQPLPETRLLNRATNSAAVLAAAIFILDIATRAAGVGMLYVLPLLVGTLGGPPRFQFVAATVVSALAVTGHLLAPAAGSDSFVRSTRAIAILVIWTTAAVLRQFRRTWLELQARTVDLQSRTKDLADTNFALDQAAIVATTDTSGKITYVNRKFCDISQYSREELLGQDHRLINSAYHSKEFIRDLWVTIANGRIWRGEIRNRAKDGSFYWVDTTIVPFLDERGKPYQYMAIRYEITARKRSEDRLREQEALARVGQMAAVVAHEVKNPIAGIRGALQVIGSRMAADARDKPIIGEIIARLDALNRIVQDLLVFARPRELRAEPTDLQALVVATVDHLKRDPSLSAVAIDVSGQAAVVNVDPEQLQLAVQNVLMNAAQAMNGSGAIHVEITRDGANWTISVADTGPGMPAEVRAKAFEPFFTTRSRGTGLGLPIARRVLEAHGGGILIETPTSGGTVVSMSLPTTS
jgi:two-component system, sporulation sensor kinase A